MGNPIVKTGAVTWFIVGLGADLVTVSYDLSGHRFVTTMDMKPDEAKELGEMLLTAAEYARERPPINDGSDDA